MFHERFSLIFTLNTLSILIFGLGSLLAPALFWAPMGVELSESARVVVRLAGAIVMGNVVLSWLVRNAPPSPVRRAVVLDFFVGWGLVFLVGVSGQISGSLAPAGWFNVGLAAIWTFVMGALLLGRRTS